MAKKSKRSVNYSMGMPGRNCGLCKFMRLPSACTLVKGVIQTKMWCELYKKR